MNRSHVYSWRLVVLFLLTLVGVLLTLFLKRFITPELLVQYKTIVAGYALEHWMTAVIGYVFAYIVIAALSLPFIGLLSAGAGYLFGLGIGAAIAIFGLSMGTMCGFLLLRFLLDRGVLPRSKACYQGGRYHKLATVISKYGAWVLLLLNALIMLPAFAINMIALFNQMSWWTVTWTAVVGGLPYLVFNVWIGHQLRIVGSEVLLDTPYHYAAVAIVIFCLVLLFFWYLFGVIRIRLTRYLERME